MLDHYVTQEMVLGSFFKSCWFTKSRPYLGVFWAYCFCAGCVASPILWRSEDSDSFKFFFFLLIITSFSFDNSFNGQLEMIVLTV